MCHKINRPFFQIERAMAEIFTPATQPLWQKPCCTSTLFSETQDIHRFLSSNGFDISETQKNHANCWLDPILSHDIFPARGQLEATKLLLDKGARAFWRGTLGMILLLMLNDVIIYWE
jgi:hypothetical protein